MGSFLLRIIYNLYYELKERKWLKMILFVVLLFAVLFLLLFGVLSLGAGGAVFLVVFGDVIVCAFIIIAIIKSIVGKKKDN